jgi:hypothetical protein
MPRRKRRTKKKPEAAPAPEPIAKTIKKRQRRRKPVAEPAPVKAEVKSVMHRILESQREQLIQLSEDIQNSQVAWLVGDHQRPKSIQGRFAAGASVGYIGGGLIKKDGG